MRPEKAAIQREIGEVLGKSRYAMLADYRGMKADQMASLRAQLRQVGTRMMVVPNSSLKYAAGAVGWQGLDGMAHGPTALVAGAGDVTAVAKILKAFAAANNIPVVRGGMMEGRVLTPEDIEALAMIEPREVLLAKLAGVLAGPMSGLVSVLKQTMSGIVCVLGAIEQKKKGQ